MRIKLITTSTSAIGYLKDYSITYIPDIIKYSDNEEYSDFIDVSSENFYNRLIYDKFAYPRVFPQRAFYIKEECKRAIEEGYDAFLFIIPSTQILDYRGNINQAMIGLDYKYEIIDSALVGYPLARIAIMAMEMINNGMELKEIKQEITKKIEGIGLILYAYNNEIEIPLGMKIEDLNKLEMDKRGKLYILENGRITPLKHDKRKPMVIEMLECFYRLTRGSKNEPFICYTQPTTYKRLLESKLLMLYEDRDKITQLPLPATLGSRLGASIIAIGYIKE